MSTPTALILHGLGHDPVTAVAHFAPVLRAGMPLLVPAGPLPFGEGDGRAWFSVAFTDQGPSVDLTQARASRDSIVAAAEHTGGPCLLFGFGQGGVVALAALLARPDLFLGCAVVSGRLLQEALAESPPAPAHRGKRLFWSHGRADPAIPFAMAGVGRAALADYGMTLTGFDHDGGHELPVAAAEALRGWISEVLD